MKSPLYEPVNNYISGLATLLAEYHEIPYARKIETQKEILDIHAKLNPCETLQFLALAEDIYKSHGMTNLTMLADNDYKALAKALNLMLTENMTEISLDDNKAPAYHTHSLIKCHFVNQLLRITKTSLTYQFEKHTSVANRIKTLVNESRHEKSKKALPYALSQRLERGCSPKTIIQTTYTKASIKADTTVTQRKKTIVDDTQPEKKENAIENSNTMPANNDNEERQQALAIKIESDIDKKIKTIQSLHKDLVYRQQQKEKIATGYLLGGGASLTGGSVKAIGFLTASMPHIGLPVLLFGAALMLLTAVLHAIENFRYNCLSSSTQQPLNATISNYL